MCPLPPLRPRAPDRRNESLEPRIQHLRDQHQQPAEEEQAQERDADDNRKRIPVVLQAVLLDLRDLHGEVARHQADGQEEHAEFGEQGRGSSQARRGLGIFLGVDVEVLSMQLADVLTGGCAELLRQLTVDTKASFSVRNSWVSFKIRNCIRSLSRSKRWPADSARTTPS